jgi:hypothetical protein
MSVDRDKSEITVVLDPGAYKAVVVERSMAREEAAFAVQTLDQRDRAFQAMLDEHATRMAALDAARAVEQEKANAGLRKLEELNLRLEARRDSQYALLILRELLKYIAKATSYRVAPGRKQGSDFVQYVLLHEAMAVVTRAHDDEKARFAEIDDRTKWEALRKLVRCSCSALFCDSKRAGRRSWTQRLQGVRQCRAGSRESAERPVSQGQCAIMTRAL